jgi:hypothetical protein
MYKAMGAPPRKTSTISSSTAILLEILVRRVVLSLKRRFPVSTRIDSLLPFVDTMKESERRARLKVRPDLVTLSVIRNLNIDCRLLDEFPRRFCEKI